MRSRFRGYLVLAVAVLAACDDAATTTTTTVSSTTSTGATSSSTTVSSRPAEVRRLAVWFPTESADRITPETRLGQADVGGVMRLLTRPLSPDLRSALEAGTHIRHETARTTVSVELDPPPSAIGRAAVAASLRELPEIDDVRINGEVVAPDDELIAKVTITEPGPGDQVTSLVQVRGTAIAFENTVNARLVDSGGRVLWTGFDTTDAPDAGQRGSFELVLEFAIDRETPAELEVFSEFSAVGEESFSRTLPLVLVPG